MAEVKDKVVTVESLKVAYDDLKNDINNQSVELSGQINGKVPTGRTVNGKALNENIVLTHEDVGALSDDGGDVNGDINMKNHIVTGLKAPTVGSDAVNMTYADSKLSKAGGTMTGNINMGNKKISNLPTPTDSADAATKAFAEQVANNVQVELDAQEKAIKSVSLTLYADDWVSGGSADTSFTQEVSVVGMTANWIADIPSIVPSNDYAANVAARKALALLFMITTEEGKMIFECNEMKPEADVTIRIPGVLA